MNKSNPADRLDAFLLGCEDLVLTSSNADLDEVASGEIEATASFIAARVAKRRAAASPAGRPSTRTVAARRAIPRDAAGRRRLLGRLIASRPELPTRISMAFKSREPEDSEIAEMLEELLRNEDGPVTR